MSGTLHLVGVGPGDPELLTLKAARILGAADVIAYPSTGDGSTLALDIAGWHLSEAAERLPVSLPITIERGPAQAAYDGAAAVILGHLSSGRDVAWLCEGDPLFYGSAMYLLARIAGRAPIAIIPGVTSLTASAAAAGRPLASRNDVLKVLPAPLPDDTLRRELTGAPAVAVIKVGRHFDRIRALLAETGHADNAIVVEHATTARERVLPLAEVTGGSPYFSTILCYSGAERWA